MMRSAVTFFPLAMLALCMAAPTTARPLVELEVVDRDSGRALPQIPHRADRWIIGTPGHSYAVRLTNTSNERVLVVLSVDGINAVTGQTASTDQGGYVLGPGQSSQIAGWRKSHDDVARFVFTDLPDSYAARTGRPQDVGVIGIATFREARRYPHPSVAASPPAMDQRLPERSSARSESRHSQERHSLEKDAAMAAETADRQLLGTGHGPREHSPVSSTRFERATAHATQTIELRYDTRSRLIALGVLPQASGRQRPRAFPGGFVADPPY